MYLSEKIVKLRKEQKMSQEELAEKLNISRQAVSRWEGGSALPDAMNILQLSKLFGVTADYLLNDEYNGDSDIPVVKYADIKAKNKIRKITGLCIAMAGGAGNFIIYILSRMIKVMVPVVTYDNAGTKWYTWNSGITDYSYRYFIREHNLELLIFVFSMMTVAGVLIIFTNKEKINKYILKIRSKIPFHKNFSQTMGQDR